MIKLVSDTIDRSDINALIQWLSQDPIPRLTKGELTVQLEEKWAKKIGTKYSIFVNSGSSAIFLMLAALKELKWHGNNKIIIPALSWATDLSSPMLLGYDPIICDCNLEDLSVDLNHLEQVFISHKPSTLLLVSPLGLVPNMNEVIQLCANHNVRLLEDVCESIGSKYNDKYLGSFGFASVFSTYFGHHISTIEGGFINTDSKKFYETLLMMRSHGWDRDLTKVRQAKLREEYKIDEFKSLYTFYHPGMNLRSTDLQAFIGIDAIDKLDAYSVKRNENFNLYNKYINRNELSLVENGFISNFAYPIVDFDMINIIKRLKDKVEIRPIIAGNIASNPFASALPYYPGLDKVSRVDSCGFYLPNHHDLTEENIIKICEIVNK